MKELDKDYMKATSAEYKAGYAHGRASMMKEIVIVLAVIALVIMVFD